MLLHKRRVIKTRGSTLIFHSYALSRSRTHVHRPPLPVLTPDDTGSLKV